MIRHMVTEGVLANTGLKERGINSIGISGCFFPSVASRGYGCIVDSSLLVPGHDVSTLFFPMFLHSMLGFTEERGLSKRKTIDYLGASVASMAVGSDGSLLPVIFDTFPPLQNGPELASVIFGDELTVAVDAFGIIARNFPSRIAESGILTIG